LIASTPSAVYPVFSVAKSQGVMRIHIRPRTTILSSTSITTTLPPFDILIENYLEKMKKNRFDDLYQITNNGNIINSTCFVYFLHALFTLLLKEHYY
jgi:hypothetical protein